MAEAVNDLNCENLHPVALDDISATEWRHLLPRIQPILPLVALDDISATEWRLPFVSWNEQDNVCCTR